VPAPAEIAHLARRYEAAARSRVLEIDRMLNAREQPPEETEAELARRAKKAEAASRLIGGVTASKDMRQVLTRKRGEDERAAEARERAAQLVPMTDEEIAVMVRELEMT
jgi:hypothetical protein